MTALKPYRMCSPRSGVCAEVCHCGIVAALVPPPPGACGVGYFGSSYPPNQCGWTAIGGLDHDGYVSEHEVLHRVVATLTIAAAADGVPGCLRSQSRCWPAVSSMDVASASVPVRAVAPSSTTIEPSWADTQSSFGVFVTCLRGGRYPHQDTSSPVGRDEQLHPDNASILGW